MFRNMAVSLFEHGQIKTTLPKAKELRRVAEPLITLGKTPTVANRRLAFDRLRNRNAVAKLFDDLGVRFKERPGGYLRILKCGFRDGDNAPMAYVQLVDQGESGREPEGKQKSKKTAAKTSEAGKPAAKKKKKTKKSADPSERSEGN